MLWRRVHASIPRDSRTASVAGKGCLVHGERFVVSCRSRAVAGVESVILVRGRAALLSTSSSVGRSQAFESPSMNRACRFAVSEASGFQASRTRRQSQRPQRARLVLSHVLPK